MLNQYQILKRPIVTEKTMLQKSNANQVSFEVDKSANRIEIRKAVEGIFKVKVTGVRTMQVDGKVKRRGRYIGKRRDWKKAIVSLASNERIEFFEGV
jgi:large subunit ribosomal protein L23